MRVGILTWYKAINHGAVLQTYASSELLKRMGCTPIVLDYHWSVSDEENKVGRLLRRIHNFSIGRFFWYMGVKKVLRPKIKAFNDFISNELFIGNDYQKEKGLDAVYIGSDMVFDISEGYNPYMYGLGVPSDYIFSYAASFGYSTLEKIKAHSHYDDIMNSLQKLKEIGYRDENTLQICTELAPNVSKTENIDPVLCYGFKREIKEWDTGKWNKEKYLLIYAYDSTMNDKETVGKIRSFARKKGLKIVSCGYYHKWADESIPASPKEFLEMFKNANYIVTDTFHGTVFSLLLHKNFATFIRNNGFKVKHLLDSVQLEDRIVNDNMEQILNKVPQFQYFDSWLDRERKKSTEFIERNINAVR